MPGATGITFPDPGTFCQAANSLWHQTKDPDAEIYILLTEKNRNLVATKTKKQNIATIATKTKKQNISKQNWSSEMPDCQEQQHAEFLILEIRFKLSADVQRKMKAFEEGI